MDTDKKKLVGVGRHVEIDFEVVVVLVGYTQGDWSDAIKVQFEALARHALQKTGVEVKEVTWLGDQPHLTLAWTSRGSNRSVAEIVLIIKSATARGVRRSGEAAANLCWGNQLWTPHYGAFATAAQAHTWGEAQQKRMAKLSERAKKTGCAGNK